MKYVITGGAGFIGSNIVKLLVEKGHKVIIIDNLHTGSLSRLKEIEEKITFNKIDIGNYEKLIEIIKDADGIFHQAALTIVPESFLKPDEYFDVNVNGTKNIFTMAKELGIKVVFASSSSVYGNVKEVPIKENFEKNPINPYGKTKVEKESLAEKFWNEGVNIIGLRYFNVYGIGQTGTYAGVITKFLENTKNQKPFIINGTGNQVRDFIHVKDLAKANLVAMESKIEKGFFNIGTGISTSINDLAKLMIELSHHEQGMIHGPPLEGDVEISQADMTFSKKSFNWNHEINLIDGLRDLIQSYLS